MRPSELAAIRPRLQEAVDDIDNYLTGLEEREKVECELSEVYDLMAAGKTPPEVKEQGKPVQLTKKQKKVLAGLKPNCFQLITDGQAEALAALPGEPMSDEGWAALQFALRGGWRESSRRVAAWLRIAGETVAAAGIEVALSELPDEPSDAREPSGYLETMRTAAEYVKSILSTYLAEDKPPAGGRPRGRKRKPHPREDEIMRRWDSSEFTNHKDLADELKLPPKTVKRVIDTVQARRRRAADK